MFIYLFPADRLIMDSKQEVSTGDIIQYAPQFYARAMPVPTMGQLRQLPDGS
jgi:hypothetical protein